MSATQSERFTIKILMLIGANGGNVDTKSLSGLLGNLSNIPFEKIQELLDELLSCCEIVKDNIPVKLTPANVDGFISERNTLLKLRAEAFKYNDFFQMSGLNGLEAFPAQADIKRKG
jgi:hypothetical protein